MSRDTPTRRLTRPAVGGGVASARAETAEPVSLLGLLAQTPRLIDVLPHLHQHALDATGGVCSLLFEYNPRNGAMQATSGFGLDELRTDPWTAGPHETDLVNRAFRQGGASLVERTSQDTPELAARLGTPSALLVPLVQQERRVGLVAVGFLSPPAELPPHAGDLAHAFVAALELFRLRQRDELQRDLRELIDEFTTSLSATLNLSAGLDVFCHGANRLFGADCTSVWIHDRRARHLVLEASSDPEHVARGASVASEDPFAPQATAMRRARAEILQRAGGDVATTTVTVPLRGCRRALGTIVFEGVRIEAGDELDLLDRADELGRQLASAVENIQLLDDVMRSRRELENTFDSIAHLVVVSDNRGRIVHANGAFATRVRQSREALLDAPLADWIGPELAAWIAAREQSPVRSDDTSATLELNDPVLNGPLIVTVTDLVDQDRQRAGTVVVARDMTPQTRLEAEREELRKRLNQSEKLAALGQFVAGIAHELNNPLQGVLGHLELLRRTGSIPRPVRKDLALIYREADRAAKIVRNLLVFAGSRRLARRSVSVTGILQKVIALRQAAFRAQDIEVVRNYAESLPRIQSDPLLLHQVFLNMVMNAEQAISATGRPGRIEIGAHARDDRIVVTVRDTGAGIPPDAISRIFEPFYTTKEVGKGTGLGLAIVYGIVQDHGGQITAANHPEGGAIFTVDLPARPRPA
jgi:signal transduction histidine kinase